MNPLLGKLVCAVTRKHKRGKRIERPALSEHYSSTHAFYECQRCKATWTRKVAK